MITIEQLKERKKGIGGSDAAAVCGLSKWKTPIDVYFDKITSFDESDLTEDKKKFLKRGTILESFVDLLFSEKVGMEITKPADTIWSTKNDFMFANIDGYINSQKAIVEYKTSNFLRQEEWGEQFSDHIPKEYMIQVQHYMQTIPEAVKAYVPVLFGNDDFLNSIAAVVEKFGPKKAFEIYKDTNFNLKIYEVFKSKDFGNKLEAIERQMWEDHIKKQVPPPWKTKEDLEKIFPISQDKTVVANKEDLKIIIDINEKKKLVESIENEIERKKMYLCERLKEASFIKDIEGSTLVTWKNQERKTFDIKKFSDAHPDLLNQFYQKKTLRVLRIAQ